MSNNDNDSEWGCYAQSASEAIFRARAYSHKLVSVCISEQYSLNNRIGLKEFLHEPHKSGTGPV